MGLTGGHALHGDMAPDQLLFLRPARGWANYRTPIAQPLPVRRGHPSGRRRLRRERPQRGARGAARRAPAARSSPMTDVPHIATPPPGPRTREVLERQKQVLYRGLAHEVGPVRHPAQVRLRDRGRRRQRLPRLRQRDGVGARSARRVPTSRDAAIEALRRYGNEDAHYYSHEYMLPLAERLLAIAPGALSRVDIALNGTEAVETAIRFMRRATGRPIVIGFMGGYHGEAGTAGAVGAETSDLSFGYRALMPGFVHVPYPNPYRTPFVAAAGRHRRRHGRLHPRPPALPRGRPARGRRFHDRARHGLGGLCRAARTRSGRRSLDLCREFDFLLGRRRGEDRVRPHRAHVRRGAVGRASPT